MRRRPGPGPADAGLGSIPPVPAGDPGPSATAVLIRDYDDLGWRSRPPGFLAADLADRRALWYRIANLYEQNVPFLDLLPRGSLVLWKLEHWGNSTPHHRIPATPGADPVALADRLLGAGHRIVPYTFTERGADRLRADLPPLREKVIEVLPVAQKGPVFDPVVLELRARFGIGRSARILGAGGQFDPAKGKGLDELAVWFLRTPLDPDTHLLCSLIMSGPEVTAADVRRRWERLAGVGSSPRLHIQIGEYGEWAWMCAFYREIDALLVNSVSDSWGRMPAEAFGFGVPVLMRRADCATNEIVPRAVLVEDFAGLTPDAFESALREARYRAPALAEFVDARFSGAVVRPRAVQLLRRHTPDRLRAEFDRLCALPISAQLLDTLLVK